MRSDVRFQLKVALETHALSPTAVSDELKRRFLKKAELEIWMCKQEAIPAFLLSLDYGKEYHQIIGLSNS